MVDSDKPSLSSVAFPSGFQPDFLETNTQLLGFYDLVKLIKLSLRLFFDSTIVHYSTPHHPPMYFLLLFGDLPPLRRTLEERHGPKKPFLMIGSVFESVENDPTIQRRL